MSILSYSPDILIKINKVCKEPAFEIVSSFSDKTLLIDDVEEALNSIYSFIASNYKHLGSLEYILKINFSEKDTAGSTLTPQFILQQVSNNNQLFEVNQTCQIISYDRLSGLSDSMLCRYTRDNDCVLLFILNGIDTKLYCRGTILSEVNALNPEALPKVNKKTSRSAQDYKFSLLDFYNDRIRNNITKHWKVMPKRILEGGKTEDIFQFGLTNWLYENITGARVIPQVKKISQDTTDIEIIEHGGNSYLIEIKWLGINEAGTSYTETRVRDAIYQVRNYLETDRELVEATIVVYDGRSLSEFKKLNFIEEIPDNWKELNECMTEMLPLKGKAFVFYLVSEPASSRKHA